MSTNLAALEAHQSDIKVSLTGRDTTVPGNLVSRSLYRYHCVHKTSLGDLILGASISENMQKSMPLREKFDFFMHYVGCFVLIIILLSISPITEPTKPTFVVWIVACVLYLLHFLNLVSTIAFFWVPLHRAKNVALLVQLKDMSGFTHMNEFIKIEVSHTSTYAITDFQAAIIAQANTSGSIQLMVYGKKWSAHYNHFIGILNAFIHFIPFIIVLIDPHNVGGVVGCYIGWYITWSVMLFYSIKFHPQCFDVVLFWFFCVLLCCAPGQKDILDRVQSGKTKSAELLTYMRPACSAMEYF
eukprot:gene14996-20173_t